MNVFQITGNSFTHKVIIRALKQKQRAKCYLMRHNQRERSIVEETTDSTHGDVRRAALTTEFHNTKITAATMHMSK